jgi:hypothetical protein
MAAPAQGNHRPARKSERGAARIYDLEFPFDPDGTVIQTRDFGVGHPSNRNTAKALRRSLPGRPEDVQREPPQRLEVSPADLFFVAFTRQDVGPKGAIGKRWLSYKVNT